MRSNNVGSTRLLPAPSGRSDCQLCNSRTSFVAMRFPWCLAVLSWVFVGCAVDKGPSACVEGMIAACDCPGGAVSQQVCVDGAFQACGCGMIAGSGGTGGSAGTGGVAGFAGTGGIAGSAGTGGVAGFAGTGGSGGIASSAGSGGVAGSGGTGGTAGSAGSGGPAGVAGTGGFGGSGGDAGSAGISGDGSPWSRCDVSLNSSDCDEGLVCYRSTLSSSGPGFCTNECTESSECKQIEGADVTAGCGSEGVCRFTCAAFGTGMDCPLGMMCLPIEPFVYRCVYTY